MQPAARQVPFRARLKTWAQRQPADVAPRYQPVVSRDRREGGARRRFGLELLGERARLADALFDAARLEGLDLNDEAVMTDWAARQGVDRQRCGAVWRSVQRQVDDARTVARRCPLTGVPVLVVFGRYRSSNAFRGSADETPARVDRLVQKARPERAQRSR